MKQENNGLSKRNLWCYAVGTIGRDMAAGGLFIGHLLNYILFTKSLTAQQFTAITVIMMAARIFDAFNDPIMGNILDVTKTRWGKFKPWILSGTVLTVLIIIISFTNTLQGWSYVLLFGVMYLAFSVTFTMNDISYWGMLPSLASNADDRNRLTSITSLMAGIGAFLCGLIAPTFTAGERVIGGSAVTAYAVIAVLFCVCMLITQLITVFGVKEAKLPKHDEKKPSRISLKTIVNTIRSNTQVLWSGIIFLIYYLVTTTTTILSTNYLYFSFGYNGLYVTLFTILGQAVSVVIYTGFAAISRRISRKKLIQIATVLSVGGYLVMLLAGVLLPNSLGMGKLAVMAVCNLFTGTGNGLYYLIMMINIANAVEYNEWKYGERNEGIIFSVRPFVTKLGMAFAQFIAMLVYLLVGVLDVTNRISDIENAASKNLITMAEKTSQIEGIIAGVPASQSIALLLFLTLLPAAGILTAYIFYKKYIILDEEYYEKITKEIREQ